MDGSDLQHIPVNLPLGSQLPGGFDPNDSQPFQSFGSAIGDMEHGLSTSNAYVRPPRPGNQPNGLMHQSTGVVSRNSNNGRFAVPPPRPGQDLTPANSQVSQSQPGTQSLAPASHSFTARNEELELVSSLDQSLQQPTNQLQNFAAPESTADKQEGHFSGMKLIPNPPDLQAWRERLFNVDEPITLTEEQFQTYFPHVDNVYSHRSTQRYKRKPFISHYWDCRLKGRPPGTPKSDDPNKKKRKRTARQRDLCDVKIKITEWFPGVVPTDSELGTAMESLSADAAAANPFFTNGGSSRESQPFGVLAPGPALPEGHPARGQKYYTIQRVNGNGGNGKSDGVSGGHRHTLEDSDRVKRNSVQRWLMKQEKEKKKAVQAQEKTYHKKATGQAVATVKKHSKECDLKLYASCFCPFVQRVWIALEVKGIPYQYIEVDPYKKPESLLEVNPRGLVPALRHGNWGCYESSVLLEYLEDLHEGTPLLPPGDPKLRAHCRLWADHINRHIIPCFYRVLQEQDPQKQAAHTEELKNEISKLVNASHVHGPFFLGPSISYVDIHIAPWILRLSRVLKPYRGWPDPEMGSRWAAWVNAIESNEHVMATTSSDELYLDSYERYAGELPCTYALERCLSRSTDSAFLLVAENRPNTSQLANAINSGRGLP
ncbi:hypothetical protein VTN77DRAFT_6736 [Rasamsonia byssochlamydoides]|uniref:uncharacterized protein n=1 Tax=Rasamsonia byssochlamydoides TaxID=89139 RepID=UPI0037444A69